MSWFERNATTGALTFITGGCSRTGWAEPTGSARSLRGRGFGRRSECLRGGSARPCGELVRAQRDHGRLDLRRNGQGRREWGGWLELEPERILVSPDDQNVYATGIWDMAVSWYERNATGGGALHYGGVVKDGVNGVDGLLDARSLALSADGKHLYATGESDNALGWYERNATTGALVYGGMLKNGVSGVMA